ncbi:hypothetical protein Esti_001094 [Eimeria stiedai]
MRMAALLPRRWTAFRLVALPLVLQLIFGGLVGYCPATAADEAKDAQERAQVKDQAASMRQEQPSVEEALRLTESAADGRKDPSLSKLDPDELEDLDLLRNCMAAADTTETEKQTDARFLYVLGLSRRIKRHLVVDFLGLMVLLAGYYLIVTAFESKAPKKTAGNDNPKKEA